MKLKRFLGADAMVSGWWVLAAFFAGGYAGFLLMALMTMTDSTASTPGASGHGAGGVAHGGWR
jgi:hypothetical protein